jgi:mRNA-degrading endonuclease RelE of RelBE toxin-antitoxin system
MNIVETTIFTRRVTRLLADDEYRLLQQALLLRPDMGLIITGSGGIRKVRWKVQGSGKRGGVRVIYYWAVAQETILMLFIYGKNEHSDLTPAQVKTLRQIVEEEYP